MMDEEVTDADVEAFRKSGSSDFERALSDIPDWFLRQQIAEARRTSL